MTRPTSHDDHDLGFAHDLPRLINRRRLLAGMGAGLTLGAAAPSLAADCVALPWETAGPYPADGSNRRGTRVINALNQSGILRQDLRASFNGMEGTADGVKLDLELTLVAADGCTPLLGRAVYLWHCDAIGRYSLYDLPDANYLRGLGVSDASGVVRFTTIFPGCYPSRWPHIHFEVFDTVDVAVGGVASALTAQIALPEAACTEIYQDRRYSGSPRHLSRISLARDTVFGDNSDAERAQQTLAVSSDPVTGYLGKVTIPIDPAADRGPYPPAPPGMGGMMMPPAEPQG